LLGYIQRRQGKWEQSLESLEKSFKFNPRYSQLAYEIGISYLAMRKYAQAEEWFGNVLSINPEHFNAQLGKVSIRVLSEGNTKDARALLEMLPRHRLSDYMRFTLGMLEGDYQKVLDLLVSLSYTSYEGQHLYFHKNLAFASVYHAMKEFSLMKTHAVLARTALEKTVEEYPDDPRYHAALGLAYAYLGHKAEAVREGNRAVTLYPISKDAALGPVYVYNLARIYTVVGVYERAIEQLEYLLSIPSCEYLWHIVSVPILKLDPQWDMLRGDPGFRRLMKKSPNP
jgi:serine/threonine-protein kinase